MNITLGEVVDYIILIGALCVAITNIIKFFKNPKTKMDEKKEKEEEERVKKIIAAELPAALEAHDLEIRGKYLQDRYRYLLEIKEAVLEETKETLKQVESTNLSQSDIITVLVQTSKDVLRQRIMTIYHSYKKEKRLPLFEREAVDELYKDYKAQGGNSYIDKYYGRILKWEVYDDEEYED